MPCWRDRTLRTSPRSAPTAPRTPFRCGSVWKRASSRSSHHRSPKRRATWAGIHASRSDRHGATLRADGAPHTVPVWIGLEESKLAILTSPQSQKARNLGRDPRVAISITDRAQPTSMASIRGRVTDIIRDEPAWKIIDRISHKYIGQPYPRGEDRIVFIIEVDDAFAHTFG